MDTLGKRLKKLRKEKGFSQTEAARSVGIPQTTWSNYENGRSKPDYGLLEKVTGLFGVRLDWLLFERGPRHERVPQLAVPENRASRPPRPGNGADEDNSLENVRWQDVPVVGLAHCGERNWCMPGKMALRAGMLVEYPCPRDLFAVLAVGCSMQPEGIRQGYVAFCDPSASIEAGDVIYIEKADGTASLKRFLSRDAEKLHVQGWCDPLPDGSQTPYFEEISHSEVRRVVCVVVVKRKG